MPLVAIRNLTEAQARAWVAGPLSEEIRQACELQSFWSGDLGAWVACIHAPFGSGRIGVGVGLHGDADLSCKIYAIRNAVADAASVNGIGAEAVRVPGEEATPEALLRHAFDYLVSTHCPDWLEGCDVTDGEQCENCWRKHLTWWARGAKEATTGAHEADRRA